MRAKALALVLTAFASNAAAQTSGPDMLERVLPAVVSVGVLQTEGEVERAFGFGGATMTEAARQAYARGLDLTRLAGGSGSGFVVQNGNMKYVVTNAHVIGHAAPNSIVAFSITGKPYAMKLIGADTYRDVAVLGFTDPPGAEFSTVTIHAADDLRVGTPVYAIGNPLGYLPYTVTAGVIGAMNRSVSTSGKPAAGGFLQTDAAILPGNSGGPLFGPAGDVVGINTAVGNYKGQQGAQLNYAVEGRHLARMVNDIITHGRVQRGYLGIVLMEPASDNIVLDQVTIGSVVNSASPLAAHQGARVVSINGRPIRRLNDAFAQLEEELPGQNVTFRLVRTGGSPQDVTVRTETLTTERLAGIGSWVISSIFGAMTQQTTTEGTNALLVQSNGAVANGTSWRATDDGLEEIALRAPRAGDYIFVAGLLVGDYSKFYFGGTLQEVATVARLTLMNGMFSTAFMSGEETYVTTAEVRPMTIF